MIDIRTLRIGSHVECEGRRVRVCGITRRKVGYHAAGKPCEHLSYARIENIQPIQITSSLLTELGFEDYSKCFYGEWEKRWNNEKYMCFSAISDNRWRVHYMDGCLNLGNCVCRYLHEAEAFLALHGIELINN